MSSTDNRGEQSLPHRTSGKKDIRRRASSGRTARLVPVEPLAETAQRRAASRDIRIQAAEDEFNHPITPQATNGDEQNFPSRIGNFSKTLPHDDRGEVDPAAYNVLLKALEDKSFAAVETVPSGGTGRLLNPLGGLAFTLEGADSPAISVNPPPSITSARWAAQMAELYWMALLRDIPFSEYASHPLVREARRDLAQFSGYEGPKDPVTGEIRPNDLFRATYPGVQDGPFVSQFLLQDFVYDGITVVQKISTAAPDQDFLTFFPEWLTLQRGNAFSPGQDPRDPTLRFVRNVRDMGRTAGQDTINSQYFKAALILSRVLGNEGLDPANPYVTSTRQSGFATFGIAHLLELMGKVHKSERHTWYQKWLVHRFLRPEAGGARVHNALLGVADYPLHEDLLKRSSVPFHIFELNRRRNRERPEVGRDVGTFLRPQMFRGGGPSHPAFPAGHAISAGACVTLLKAWFREDVPFPNPLKSTPDGLGVEPYRPGVDGPVLTIGGELNKLAHNISVGRDMSGVHWRADDVEGNRQGEEAAIRILREETAIYPETFSGFSLTRFDGTAVTLK
jgi:hypothetical protein